MRVLVTGGAGFIGSHLVEALLAGGYEVVTLDDLSTGLRANLESVTRVAPQRHHFIEGDIMDPTACREACRGVEVVFHQAAVGSVPRSMADPGRAVSVNVAGTTEVLQAARQEGARRVVFASSSSVYGDSTVLPKREGEEGWPLSPYAESKVMTERLAALFGRCFGLESVGLRYFNVYGPRQRPDGPYAAVIPRFASQIALGVAPTIYGDGEQSRDFTYVADVVQANLLAATAPRTAAGRAFNVAGGRPVTVNRLARTMASILGREVEPVHLDERAGDVRHSHADVALATEALGFRATMSLEDGLDATVRAMEDGRAQGR